MNTNAIGPNGPSDDELLAGVRRRMAAVEPLVPLPGTWHSAGVPVGSPVRVGIRSRIGFAGLAPLVLVAVLVVAAVGFGMGSKTWGGAGSDPSMATLTYKLVAVNGQPLGLSVSGTTSDALDSRALAATACGTPSRWTS